MFKVTFNQCFKSQPLILKSLYQSSTRLFLHSKFIINRSYIKPNPRLFYHQKRSLSYSRLYYQKGNKNTDDVQGSDTKKNIIDSKIKLKLNNNNNISNDKYTKNTAIDNKNVKSNNKPLKNLKTSENKITIPKDGILSNAHILSNDTHKILHRKNQQRLKKKIFLNEANSFYKKFILNIKWYLIKENRPFSYDEISALFSWFLVSQMIWIILSTTTFVSIILFLLNTVFAKEAVGKFIGRSLNFFLNGIDIDFGEAIIPEWKKKFIKFHNVRIKSSNTDNVISNGNKNEFGEKSVLEFDLSIHDLQLTISLKSWLLGKGLLQELKIFGMEGNLHILPNPSSTDTEDIPSSDSVSKYFSNQNYELQSIHIEDSRVKVYDEHWKQYYDIALYNLELPKLRIKWMLFDFLNANIVDGSVNGALFSFHKKQHKLAYLDDRLQNDLSQWQRITRLRLDSININELGFKNTKNFNWFANGKLEVIADIMLPHIQNNDFSSNDSESKKYIYIDLKFKFKDLKANMPTIAPILSTGEQIISVEEMKLLAAYINTKHDVFNSITTINHSHNSSWKSPNASIKKTNKSYPQISIVASDYTEDKNDIKQIYNNEVEQDVGTDEYLNQQIIKFHDQIFQNETNEIILRCRIAKDIASLENVTLFKEADIYDPISMELYADFMKLVEEWEYKRKNDWMKIWGSTLASQIIFFGFGAMV